MNYRISKRRRRGKLDKCYTLFYRIDSTKAWKQKALGITNKRVAENKAIELVRQMELEAAGLTLPHKQIEAVGTPIHDQLSA